ncbi:MAG TPA: PVC-type heme-binding CxxCH protein [Candidatus Saccharimonadales bacterium]|nr:PVC-type heme-binding CxxCH protein [Candidatus Saccharimonadales bacterium]
MKLSLSLLLAALNVSASEFPLPYNSEKQPGEPMSAAEAAKSFRLTPGFKATVFAAEPDVQNPIAMTWDSAGRLWVAENYTYAERSKRFDLNLRDRIVIFEDKDGDGRFDTRQMFTDEVQMLTSVEVGMGGVWAMCPPQLLFIPDYNRDGIPDGAPEVLLDGFKPPPENYHNFANGLRFGPDGWLYGRCGASSPGEIGAPGTPSEQRIPMRGTIWRYHPTRKVVEVLSSGCTNPWGHDWNEQGELFFINTVNGQLWHGITGAHYVRPHTIDPNPRAYELIDQHADHWHFNTAEGWSMSNGQKADSFGGGHAHIGMMIYQGNNWPEEYHGHLFTFNMHGLRANQEILERSGSGYVGRHGKDMLFAADPWFRGIELSYGPDGGVVALDWSDTGECHENTGVHRTSGRIYKFTYGEPTRSAVGDIAKSSLDDLVKLHTHSNEWFSRQARLELTYRARSGQAMQFAKNALRDSFETNNDVVVKLRAFWTLYDIGGADAAFLRAQLRHSDEHIRTWAVRFLSDTWPLDTVMSQRPLGRAEAAGIQPQVTEFARMARKESSGLVRLALASVLQRLPLSQRANLAEALLGRSEDAKDHNLPLLIWYGLIPLAETDPEALAKLAGNAELPTTRKLITRRLAEDIEKNPGPINAVLTLASRKTLTFQADVLNGLSEGLAGWRKAKKPQAWDALANKLGRSVDSALRERVRELSTLFGDGRALEEVKRMALDRNAELGARKAALQSLIDSRPADLRQVCEKLIGERFLNSVAARGLAGFDDPAVGAKLVGAYRQFHPSERGQLLSALVSRASFANALLDGVVSGKMPREEISAYHARQIRGLNEAALNKKLALAWGELRETSADKQQLINQWRARLTPSALAKADVRQGRLVFNTACAVCHTLYGEGGKIGPDLTGGGRENLDYLLENIVDPSAVVTADFRMSVIDLKDGRRLNAIMTAKTERTMTLKTMTETLTVERAEINELLDSKESLMPEGLLESLSPEQARDLIAYLMQKTQVPLPATKSRNGK